MPLHIWQGADRLMFEEYFEPVRDVDSYLKRIAYDGPRTVCRKTLDALIDAHIKAVPFENLSMYGSTGDISLAIDWLYDKVVNQRRGGCCFELNTLFTALLRGMGFECYAVAPRVTYMRSWRSMVGHRSVVVVIDGHRYFCDVGFGGPIADASLDLDAKGIQTVPMGDFYFTRENGEVNLWRIRENDEPERMMIFTETPFDERDFIPISYFYSKSPDSQFASRRMINLRTETGSKGIVGNMLKIRSGDELYERELKDTDEVCEALKEYFGLDVKVDIM